MDVWDQGCVNGVNERVRVHVGVARVGNIAFFFSWFCLRFCPFFPPFFLEKHFALRSYAGHVLSMQRVN